MAIDFPDNPAVSGTFTSNNNTWIWDGSVWRIVAQTVQGVQGTQGIQGIQGIQGLDGAFAAQGIQGVQGIQGISSPVAGSANQIVYKNPSNEPSGNANFTFLDSSTTLNIDNISIDDNTISASSGNINIVPFDSGNVLIGTSGVASGDYSSIIGGLYSKTTLYGEISHAAGKFYSDGDARHSILILRGNTTDFTETELFLDGVDKRLIIPSNTSLTFTMKVNAYDRSSRKGAWWVFSGGIRNSNDSVSIIGNIVEQNGYEGILGDCIVDVSANNTHKSLSVKVTGIRGNIRWVALVDSMLVNGDPALAGPTFDFEEFLEINTSTNNYTNLLLN